jgi:hypothetical protein
MKNGETTMIDIYEAAGGKVNEDRTQVSMNPPFEPFEIILTVLPAAIQYENEREPRIAFDVMLVKETQINGNMAYEYDHEARLELPVDQVRFAKKETDDEVARLRTMLWALGFCPNDGESMPCMTCGAGL